MRIHGKIVVQRLISYAQQEVDCCTQPITTKLQSLNVEHNFCCVKLYKVRTLVVLTLENNIIVTFIQST